MVFLVPYDGSRVSEAALSRAVEHGKAMDEAILAVSIIPTGVDYAERRKWIDPDDDLAAEAAGATLKRKIEEATDTTERTFERPGAQSPDAGLSKRIREVAREIDASTLFVGASSENSEDGLETPFGSVAPDAEYDIHIVRTA